MTDEALWSADDVARYLNVSRSWVYARATSGELPHRRMGGLLRFVPEQVREYARGSQGAPVVTLLRGGA